jgi:hypothetical protein
MLLAVHQSVKCQSVWSLSRTVKPEHRTALMTIKVHTHTVTEVLQYCGVSNQNTK